MLLDEKAKIVITSDDWKLEIVNIWSARLKKHIYTNCNPFSDEFCYTFVFEYHWNKIRLVYSDNNQVTIGSHEL